MKILRRRKKTLSQWAAELGVSTYANAEIVCDRIGVKPPTREEWKEHIADPELPPMISDPSGGVVVIDTAKIPAEITDSVLDELAEAEETFSLEEASEEEKKKPRKRRSTRSKKTSSQEDE